MHYIAGAIFIMVALAVAWLTTGTYARIETVLGIVTTTTPSAKVIAQAPGVVANLNVKDGDIVQKGQPLLVVHLGRTSKSGSEITERSLRALSARRALAKDQVNLSFGRAAADKARLASVASAAEQAASDLRKQIVLQREAVASNQLLFDRLSTVEAMGELNDQLSDYFNAELNEWVENNSDVPPGTYETPRDAIWGMFGWPRVFDGYDIP